jgi:4-alpha-glucanotransferase
VKAGARLFSTPDAPDHPSLARFSIARAGEIDRDKVRWDDAWVRALDDTQVARYATLFDLVVARLAAHGRRSDATVCEILSTWPYPIRRVMERAGLGRLCVTQKANLDDPGDVYRSENARAQDWIMVGNHDTPSLWRLVERWHGTPVAEKRARHLAERLETDQAARPQFAASLCASPGQLATAMFAELFVGPARYVSIFFADLLGYQETYNVPGTISDENWSLRVAPDYAGRYARAIAGPTPRALDLRRALAMALRARRLDPSILAID